MNCICVTTLKSFGVNCLLCNDYSPDRAYEKSILNMMIYRFYNFLSVMESAAALIGESILIRHIITSLRRFIS